jgi:hypothetical protein
MGRTVSPAALGEALEEELTLYHKAVTDRVDAAGEKAIKNLVKKTKASAPVRLGKLKKAITYTAESERLGAKTYVLYAKAPTHRVFHLAVHGHATATGGRAKGNAFLQNALDAVLPVYEEDIEEAMIE